MWLDVIDLSDFYASPLGRLVRRLIGRRLQEIWPDSRTQRVLGLGFAVPYLPPFRDDAERALAVMPPGQGVIHWPDDGPGLVCLADEFTLPLPDRSIDRILIAHCLEGSAEPRLLMRECWRVLADGGRILVVVANRSSLWARFEPSPFAHGRPYSLSQITKLMRDGLFAPRQTAKALFLPPVWWRLFGNWAGALDQIGSRWFPTLAGVHIVEAEKQIYAIPLDAVPAAIKNRTIVAKPAANGLGQTARPSLSHSASARTLPVR
ncbi:MAG: methyltransferase domain-containing protein [Rhodospirillaceae bacterium]|nr:methyltransferase domain-containing protein [Rhodospirillaceae bacterium]